jgi:hypothetical protein
VEDNEMISAMDKMTGFAPSAEADILRQIDELIRKLAIGKASSNDVQRLQELQKTRTDMMRPALFD